MKSISLSYGWLLTVLIASSSQADNLALLKSNPQLSLKIVLEQTLAQHPKQAQWHAAQNEVAAQKSAASSLLPGGTAVSANHQSDRWASKKGLQEWEVAIEMPLWLAGQKQARTQVADATGELYQQTQQVLNLELAGQLREQLWEIALRDNQLDQAKARVESARILQLDVEKRWQSGELAKTDLLLAQNETLLAETARLHAATELKNSEQQYFVLSGLRELPSNFDETPSPSSELPTTHPFLALAQQQVLLAQQELSLARVEKREAPSLSFNLRNERGDYESSVNHSVGIGLRLPLSNETQHAPQLRRAEHVLSQAESELKLQQKQLQQALLIAHNQLEQSRETVAVLEQQHALAQESLRLAKHAFDLGETDLNDLLRIRVSAHETERQLNAEKIQLQANIARYNQAMGVLP